MEAGQDFYVIPSKVTLFIHNNGIVFLSVGPNYGQKLYDEDVSRDLKVFLKLARFKFVAQTIFIA